MGWLKRNCPTIPKPTCPMCIHPTYPPYCTKEKCMSVEPGCANSLMDTGEFKIPVFMQHLIDRPCRHMPVPGSGFRGIVIMEFDKQIFRRDIGPFYRETICPTCKQTKPDDLKDQYEQEVGAAVVWIAKEVNIYVRRKMNKALAEMGMAGLYHGDGRPA